MRKYLIQILYWIVGWVEVTKPFGYAQGNAQQAQKTCVGFRYRSTQPTNSTRKHPSAAIFKRLAAQVSLRRCEDKSFQELKEKLQTWFPKN